MKRSILKVGMTAMFVGVMGGINLSIAPANSTAEVMVIAQLREIVLSSDGFFLPSKNIYCRVRKAVDRNDADRDFLRCEIASSLKPTPPQPSDCQLDWGSGLVLPITKKAEVLCAGDTIYDATYPTLQYGQTWKNAGFTCSATRDGLTCTNPQGNGFFLNREEWRTF
ncbi:MAG: hypothetical protein HC786_06565 [Richelia sp. CSU_2_1]|nr:hypothetical protein [Microcoleus sp. SM1_3_4]NJR21851.1 hypothetical protein [Richelia sp. CSU_2_1]